MDDGGGWRRPAPAAEPERRAEPESGYQRRNEDSGRGGFGERRPEGGDRDRGFGDRKPGLGDRGGFGGRGAAAPDSGDSWRRGGREEPEEERRPTGGRSYRDERSAPAPASENSSEWTQVRGKK